MNNHATISMMRLLLSAVQQQRSIRSTSYLHSISCCRQTAAGAAAAGFLLPNDVRLGGVRGMAKKKAGGSSTNGRESAGRRLGIKVWPNTFASEYSGGTV